ncbi:MAG: nuclease [Bacteroidales bacterium]|nr:nuclease [Bacteroidales bacterium]
MNSGTLLPIFLILSLSSCQNSSRHKDDAHVFFTVTRVIDGDTFVIADGSLKGLTIRLTGVDAPETRRTRNKEIGYFAQESKKYLSDLILNKRVRLEYDVDTFDIYRRTLAYVYLEDGTFLNAHLIENGYASILTVPPNVKYADLFLKLSGEARKKGRGLYGNEKVKRRGSRAEMPGTKENKYPVKR